MPEDNGLFPRRRTAARWLGPLLVGASCVLCGVWFMVRGRAVAPLTPHATAPDDAPQTDGLEQLAPAAAPVTPVANSASLVSAPPLQPAPSPTPSPSLTATKPDARVAPLLAEPAARRQRLLALAADRARVAAAPFRSPLVAPQAPPAAPTSPPVENPRGDR
jgi:hypothetical protein